jgi:uncharacterized protein
VTVHELTREEARRIAIRAQLLDRDRPTDLLDCVRHLAAIQHDQTAAVAPSADLVLWSRLGSAYAPADLVEALEDRDLIEFQGMIRPAEDIALYRADMADWPGRGELRDWQEYVRDWAYANRACQHDIIVRLRSEGPLPAKDLPDSCAVPWSSSGWTNDRNRVRLMDFMEAKGDIAVAGRNGRDRLWDLADRIYPDDPVVPAEEAKRLRNEKRLKALGIARTRTTEVSAEPTDVGDAGEPAVVVGVRGKWRVDPEQLDRPFEGRAALLSPLDRLVYDRKRMTELFEFDYQLEMYKPVAKRRWGYWAMPVLYADRLVGKLDATADRKAGMLRIDAVHRDGKFTKAMISAVDDEIDALAQWLRLHPVRAVPPNPNGRHGL